MSDAHRAAGEVVGVYGGMFDPPHTGHRRVAETAHDQLGLDRLLVLVPAVPPHRAAPGASTEQRLGMARATFGDLPWATVEEEGAGRPGPTYTVDTVAELARSLAPVKLWLVVGSDQLLGFRTWHRWTDILRHARLAVAPRRGADDAAALAQATEALTAAGGHVRHLAMEPVDVSSTHLRELAEGGALDQVARQVPAGVAPLLDAAYGRRPASR